MTESLQTLVKKRQAQLFVGRASEISAFTQHLARSVDDPERRFIFSISGQGGVGKSFLMRRLRQLADASEGHTCWTDHSAGDIVAALTSLAGTHPLFSEVRELTERYERRRYELEADPSVPAAFGRVVGASIGRGGVVLARRLPVLGAAFDFVDADSASEQMGEVAAFIAQRLKRDDARLVQAPLELMGPAFVRALSAVQKKHRSIALFLDTYEATRPYIESWLLDTLAGVFGSVPSSISIALAGRSQLDAGVWTPYETLIARFPLAPFSDAEADDLLAGHGVSDATLAHEIRRLSRGLPLVISTLASAAPAANLRGFGDEAAVERFLQWEKSPERRRLLLAACLPRHLSKDSLAVVTSLVDDASFGWIRDVPFIQPTGYGWEMHSLVRRPMLSHVLRESDAGWRAAHHALAEFHESRAGLVAPEPGPKLTNSRWRKEFGNVAYHRLLADYSAALTGALRFFLDCWVLHPSLAIDAALAVRDAEADLESDGTWGKPLVRAIEGAEGTEPTLAGEVLSRLLGFSDLVLSDTERAGILVSRASHAFLAHDYQGALTDFAAAEQLANSYPLVFYRRAYMFLDLKRPAEALGDVQRALALVADRPPDDRFKRAVHVLNATTLIALEGDAVGLPLLDSLISEHEDGLTYFTRGQLKRRLGDFVGAISDLEEAMDRDNLLAHEALKEIGLVHLAAQRFPEAATVLEESLRASPHCGHCWNLISLAARRIHQEPRDALAMIGETLADEVDPRVEGYRGIAYESLGDTDRALSAFSTAIEAGPSDYWLLWARGDLLAYLDTWDGAYSDAEASLRINPRFPPALVLRGRALFAVCRFEEAARDFRRVGEIRPAESWLEANMFGLTLANLGEYDQAEAEFTRALTLTGCETWIVRYNMAVIDALRDPAKSSLLVGVAEEASSSGYASYVHAAKAALESDWDCARRFLDVVRRDLPELASNWTTDPAFSRARRLGTAMGHEAEGLPAASPEPSEET